MEPYGTHQTAKRTKTHFGFILVSFFVTFERISQSVIISYKKLRKTNSILSVDVAQISGFLTGEEAASLLSLRFRQSIKSIVLIEGAKESKQNEIEYCGRWAPSGTCCHAQHGLPLILSSWCEPSVFRGR
jgi:hypothetical protein